MDEMYQPQAIEQAAQAVWEKDKAFKVSEDLSKEKFYCLTMFPYPSGHLHMGHVRNYTLGDVISRYQRMLGKNVLQPMGWDAFGLPAENAAIQKKILPAKWTYENIVVMRAQLKRLGFAYDWKRELTTCKPEYYRWEQWLFVKMYEKGLVYKKNALVNWDPVDKTVLANEQVIDGRGWRSGALVERREVPQWFFKITAYADELLADLNQLEQWPEQVRAMQANWIGRSEGVKIKFKIIDHATPVSVFTTRADTLFGASYLAIAPEHPLALEVAQKNKKLTDFIESCRHIQVAEAAVATLAKQGMDLGLKAIHPLTGEKLPVWVANFVLMEYGSGAVMCVPAHDERDFEFAQKYALPIKPVIQSAEHPEWDFKQAALTAKGTLINSGDFSKLDSATAIAKIITYLIEHDQGEKQVHYRLRDWGVSRQRYWGTPIPVVNCSSCGTVAVPEHDLPVVLPEDVEFSGTTSPLREMPEFHETTCPSCHELATRETDTFDTFVESAWYYARYACVNQDKAMLDDRAKYWTPVDCYIGGIEHAVMHLLYARFIHKVVRDMGLLNGDEPFIKLLTQGMVLKDGVKMSKSKGNVVDPEPLVEKYGVDTVRLFIIFAAPPEQSLEWSDSGVEGACRFLKKLWTFAYQQCDMIQYVNKSIKNEVQASVNWGSAPPLMTEVRRQIHEILRQARYDFDRQQFNTVPSGCMKMLNVLAKLPLPESEDPECFTQVVRQHIVHEALSILLRLLAPITPHLAHYLWRELGYGENILDAKLPKVNQDALKTNVIELVVQINGKLRGKIFVSTAADKETIEKAACSDASVVRFIQDKKINKVVVVPGKLVNLVVAH